MTDDELRRRSRILAHLALPFYLWAIWTVRRLILAVGQGAGHDRLLAVMLARVGIALFLGGISTVFAGPLLARLLNGRGPVAYYDVAAITVGVVGLALVIVAHLLGQAADMRAELDEIV